MTNLKPVKEGFNKFCGPAVLSILTGKSTDECAAVISRINGQYNVTGVLINDLLRAADRLGFDQIPVEPSGSLYRTLTSLVNKDGMYIVTIPKHFVCIEIKDKKIYFCDNHTKEPIPAASSARLSMPVLMMHKVIERPKPIVIEPPEPPKPKLIDTKIKVYKYAYEIDGEIKLQVDRILTYDTDPRTKVENLAYIVFKDEKEFAGFVNKVYQTLYGMNE